MPHRASPSESGSSSSSRVPVPAALASLVLGRIAEGVIVADAAGRVTHVNGAAARLYGITAVGTPVERWSATYGLHTMDGRPYPTAELPLARAALRGEEVADARWRVRRPDGTELVVEGSAAPLHDEAGHRIGAALVVREVTGAPAAPAGGAAVTMERRRSEQSARVLQALTAAFSAVLTPEEVVGVALEQAVEGLGARTGFLALVDAEGRALELLGARGYGAGFLERVRRIPLDAPSVSAEAVRTGEALWLTDPATTVRRYPPSAELYAAVVGLQATASLPLVDGRGRPFGVLVFNFDTPRAFDAEERALIGAVTRQCAQALERAQLFEAERTARAVAEEANAAKSRFLATTSHEIRTPINAILGYTELLEMGLAGPLTEGQSRYLERVRVSGRHLLGIINQVLDLAKIEAEKLELRPLPALARVVVERASALVEPQATARRVSLANACGVAGDVAYTGDPERVEQVLVNLLMNAVKFTPPGGRVTLSCGVARSAPADAAPAGPAPDGWTYFRVEDTGIGIAPERLRAIWEPFEQADIGHTRAYGGTGLGLTISRRLARLMGGDITVRSQPGEGAAFFLWLPTAAADRAAEGADAAHGERRRGGTRLARGLDRAADAALGEIERVLSGYAQRLRTDPETPSAHRLTDAELEDHAASFLADMAQCLTFIDAARGTPSEAMRDSSAIQQVIAERHGAQRARLGWSAAEVRREFTVLREELSAAVRRRVGSEPDVEVDQALALFARFLEHAERASLGTHAAPPAPER